VKRPSAINLLLNDELHHRRAGADGQRRFADIVAGVTGTAGIPLMGKREALSFTASWLCARV